MTWDEPKRFEDESYLGDIDRIGCFAFLFLTAVCYALVVTILLLIR